ncbi:MAG TPA: ferric reductase-like transmembrane domain-containing protein [Streptosporangiaceae bacterium]
MPAHLLSAPFTTGTTLLWYTTRATGIVALVLLTGTVMLGVLGTARAASARWPRLVTAGLHKNLALTSVALVAVHVITTVIDPFASISVVAAFIPFSSAYRPLWLSLGTISFDLLLAVIVTSLLRDRLKHRTWQIVHLLVYLSWPVALWHGLGTGTDTKLAWVLGIDVLCVAAVGWAVWWRLSLTASPAARAAGLASLGLIPVLTLVFVLFGPLQPGWAVRAGTPAKLLGSQGTSTGQPQAGNSGGSTGSGQGTGGQPGRLVNVRFRGRVSVASPGANLRTVTITGRTVAAPVTSFVIVLRGTPSGGGVNLSGGTVRLGQPGGTAAWHGPVVQLSGQTLVAAVSGSGGQRNAVFTLTIHGSTVTGTVSLQAGNGE